VLSIGDPADGLTADQQRTLEYLSRGAPAEEPRPTYLRELLEHVNKAPDRGLALSQVAWHVSDLAARRKAGARARRG
jgi:hypothetical protein